MLYQLPGFFRIHLDAVDESCLQVLSKLNTINQSSAAGTQNQ